MNLSRTELTHNWLGNIGPQTSQQAEPLWINPGLNSAKCAQANLHSRKKMQAKIKDPTFSPNPCKQGKSHQHQSYKPSYVHGQSQTNLKHILTTETRKTVFGVFFYEHFIHIMYKLPSLIWPNCGDVMAELVLLDRYPALKINSLHNFLLPV